MKTHPDIDYFIYGHRHIELDLMLSRKTRMMIIGDWIWQFTYVVFDGEHLFLEEYAEGESKHKPSAAPTARQRRHTAQHQAATTATTRTGRKPQQIKKVRKTAS